MKKNLLNLDHGVNLIASKYGKCNFARVRTEKEEELLALENYWKERLAAQEAETVHRQKLTEQEVSYINWAHKF